MSHTIWPENELPCLWMQAGVISFRLCDRHYNCKNCPFDKVMRNEEQGPERHNAQGWETGSPQGRRRYPLSHLYCSCGFQLVKPLSEHVAQIGLNQNAFVILPMLTDTLLPAIGSFVHKGQAACRLVSPYGEISLRAPLTGEITRTNANAREALNADWIHEVWLYSQKVNNLSEELRSMLRGERAKEYLAQQNAQIMHFLKSEIQGQSPLLGNTLMDGGAPMANMDQIFGAERYFALIRLLFERQDIKAAR